MNDDEDTRNFEREEWDYNLVMQLWSLHLVASLNEALWLARNVKWFDVCYECDRSPGCVAIICLLSPYWWRWQRMRYAASRMKFAVKHFFRYGLGS